MKSFDEWRDEQRKNIDGYTERDAYKAGAQSRQSEVDELKKRIDGAIDFLYSSNANDEYYVLQAIKILKGAVDET